MESRPGDHRIPTAWWTVILIAAIAAFLLVTAGFFAGSYHSFVPVILTVERSGLVMESGAKVKLRGVEVGRVRDIAGDDGAAALQLDIYPDQVEYIPANVTARIQATTAFGAKFVDLVYPAEPAAARISAGAVVHSANTSTEVNTIFQNLSELLAVVDPAKLNAVVTALADGVRGEGERMGQATTALRDVLRELNARSDTIREDWRAFGDLNATYLRAADDIVAVLDAAATTSVTISSHADDLDALLLNTVGLANSGTDLLAAGKDATVQAVNLFAPTTELLRKYEPVYTCWLQGTTTYLENGGYHAWGGADSRSIHLDVGLLFGNDGYRYPQNLPITGAKGGPGGAPGCGSLPDATKNAPVRQLIADTGWGTGLDIRPNPGIGNPCYANYFPVTRAVPEPASIRECLPGPAPGPIPYPGAPPYGAALYDSHGVPLWPGLPPAEPTP